MSRTESFGRVLVVVAAGVVAAAAGWLLFVVAPDSLAELLGVVLVVLTVVAALRIAGRAASSLFPDYNVAEVAVEGPITREGGAPSIPRGPRRPGADEIVEQIERADEDDNVRALLVKLNTPGGEVVPSDDIRLAAERFDGPTVAYATDVCASGGYWIASGCDELWARDGSVVGSIGVRGSRVVVADLMDRLGVDYEQFTAGEYKDAGTPLRHPEDDEREYIQGLIDDYYDEFVERVVEGRGMDPDAVRDTEARIYLGEEARELGLVDELGTREAVEDRLEAELGEAVEVREFEPEHGLTERLRGGAYGVAFALGAGLASVLAPDDEFEFRV